MATRTFTPLTTQEKEVLSLNGVEQPNGGLNISTGVMEFGDWNFFTEYINADRTVFAVGYRNSENAEVWAVQTKTTDLNGNDEFSPYILNKEN